MAIMFEPKGGRKNTEVSSTPDLLPLGQKPEGELNSLVIMQNAFNKLMSTIKKLTEENKRLKDALGITEVEEPLILTKDMEVTNGSK